MICGTPLKLRLSLALMVSFSAQSLLITASKRHGSIFDYQTNSVVFMSELLKLAWACTMVGRNGDWRHVFRQPVVTSLAFAIPGMLYIVQNNMVFLALQHLSPGLYQLFNNLKILTTGVVYRVMVRKELRVIQWLALVLLVLGLCVTADLNKALCGLGGPQATTKTELADGRESQGSMVVGLGIMVCISWCSAVAGVVNEILIKRSTSVHVASLWLYGYGCISCACCTLWTDGPKGFLPQHIFAGFTSLTWAVVLCSAFMGQTIAFIMRHADVIVKMYAAASTAAFTSAAAWALFGIVPPVSLVIGYLICMCSLVLYYLDAHLLHSSDAEFLRHICSMRPKSE